MEKEEELLHQGTHHQVCNALGTLFSFSGRSIQGHSDFVNQPSFVALTLAFSQLVFPAAVHSMHRLCTLGSLGNGGWVLTRKTSTAISYLLLPFVEKSTEMWQWTGWGRREWDLIRSVWLGNESGQWSDCPKFPLFYRHFHLFHRKCC